MITGVDIGGTKTHLRSEMGGTETYDRVILTSEWRSRRNHAADAANLVSLITQDKRVPSITVIGAHGCDSDDDRFALQARLSALLPGILLVLNDSELLLPACGKEDGISVISGTGSIAVSRDADRSMIAAGGWGWFLGDEGSASGLVRDAARAVRFSLDDGAPLDCLGQYLLDALDTVSPIDMGRAISEIGSAAGIGRLAPVVFEAADDGSRLADQVIANAGVSLAILSEKLIRRGAPKGDVVTGGGVVTRQPRLFSAFRTALSDRVPDATLTLMSQSPVAGALALARSIQSRRYPSRLPMPHLDGELLTDTDWRAA